MGESSCSGHKESLALEKANCMHFPEVHSHGLRDGSGRGGVDQVLWKWESVCYLQLFLPTLPWSAGSRQQHKFTPSDMRK